MSWVRFRRSLGLLSLYSSALPRARAQSESLPIYTWGAHNDVTSTSTGEWPVGTYKWSHYKPHEEMGLFPGCFSTAYGCHGIHVFTVLGRPGMGIHAGRTFGQQDKLGGKTQGCVRVSENAMEKINMTHNKDRLEAIVVED